MIFILFRLCLGLMLVSVMPGQASLLAEKPDLDDPFIEATRALTGITLKPVELYPGIGGYEVVYDGQETCLHGVPRNAEKIRILVHHYTEVSYPETLGIFTFNPCDEKNAGRAPVAAHYVVTEQASYTDSHNKKRDIPGGRIVRVIPESMTARHAGFSQVGDDVSINGCSIGIENVNESKGEGGRWIPFDPEQIKATAALTRAVMKHHNIQVVRGHDEVAFVRDTTEERSEKNPRPGMKWKVDPGPLFPWADVVPGHPKVPVVVQDATPVTELAEIQEAKRLLRQMGYGGPSGVHDPETGKLNEDFLLHQFGNAVQAFKGRYVWPGNPEHYTPVLDRGMLETLRVLAPSVDHGAKKGL